MTDDINIDRARMGIEAESFVASNLGRYLLQRAADEEDDLIDKLIHCKSTNIEKNTEIRNKLQVTELFRKWLDEAIQSGKISTQTIQMEEAADEE